MKESSARRDRYASEGGTSLSLDDTIAMLNISIHHLQTGPPGETGSKGPEGSRGQQGKEGKLGQPGPRGMQGDMGVPGLPGWQGPRVRRSKSCC